MVAQVTPFGDGTAWMEIGAIALILAVAGGVYWLVTGKRVALSAIFIWSFLGWFQINVIIFFLIFAALPAYMLSGAVLLVSALIVGEPVRPFMQENFLYPFVPCYLLTLIVAVYWLYGTNNQNGEK